MKVISLWILIVLFLLGGTLMQGAHLHIFFQPSSIVIVFFPITTYLFYTHGFRGFFSFWKRIITGKVTDFDVSCMDACIALGFLLGGVAVIGASIRVMGILDQGPAAIGESIAAVMVAGLYGAIPAVYLFPVRKLTLVSSGVSVSNHLKKAAGFMAIALLLNMGCFLASLFLLSSPT